MEDRFRERVQGFVEQLLKEEKSSLKKARTLLEIENQAIEIGDELVRQLANSDLTERAEKVAEQTEHDCPDCGKICALEADTEPLILQGKRTRGVFVLNAKSDIQTLICNEAINTINHWLRGEIEYSEPRCHCPSCRLCCSSTASATSSSLIGRRACCTTASATSSFLIGRRADLLRWKALS